MHSALLENAAFRAMFAARKDIFVDLLRWDLPLCHGLYEIDQFDSAEARYLILLDCNGQHRASARLLPTHKPHLLSEIFAEFCPNGVPQGPNIWEISRFCLDRRQTAIERRRARNQLVTALANHALDNQINCYTGIAEWCWFSQVTKFGWQCAQLGPARVHKGQVLTALTITITDQTIAGLQAKRIYEPLFHYTDIPGEMLVCA